MCRFRGAGVGGEYSGDDLLMTGEDVVDDEDEVDMVDVLLLWEDGAAL